MSRQLTNAPALLLGSDLGLFDLVLDAFQLVIVLFHLGRGIVPGGLFELGLLRRQVGLAFVQFLLDGDTVLPVVDHLAIINFAGLKERARVQSQDNSATGGGGGPKTDAKTNRAPWQSHLGSTRCRTRAR